MSKRIKFVDTSTGLEFDARAIIDTNGVTHREDLCLVVSEADFVELSQDDVEWNQMRRDMIREMMFARFKDSALDLPWETVSAKVGAMVDAFIAEMKKGVRR